MPITRPRGLARKAGLKLGPRGAIQPRIRVRNTSAVIANVYARDRTLQRDVRKTIRTHALLIRDLTAFLAPVDRAFMQEHVRADFGPEGLSFEVGWDPAEFAAAGLPYYPPFQEFGTSTMRAQPSLGPAYNEIAPQLHAALSRDLQAALARGAGGGGGGGRSGARPARRGR